MSFEHSTTRSDLLPFRNQESGAKPNQEEEEQTTVASIHKLSLSQTPNPSTRCTSKRHCGPTDSPPSPPPNLRRTINRCHQRLRPSGNWSTLSTVRGSTAKLLSLSERASETPAPSLAFSESVVFAAFSSHFAPLPSPILRFTSSARLSPCRSYKVSKPSDSLVFCVCLFLHLVMTKTVNQFRSLNQLQVFVSSEMSSRFCFGASILHAGIPTLETLLNYRKLRISVPLFGSKPSSKFHFCFHRSWIAEIISRVQ